MGFQDLWVKIGGFYRENRERGGAILTLNELVLTFEGLHVCVQFGEMQRRNSTVSVHRWTDTRTDVKRFYYLSHAMAMGEITKFV